MSGKKRASIRAKRLGDKRRKRVTKLRSAAAKRSQLPPEYVVGDELVAAYEYSGRLWDRPEFVSFFSLVDTGVLLETSSRLDAEQPAFRRKKSTQPSPKEIEDARIATIEAILTKDLGQDLVVRLREVAAYYRRNGKWGNYAMCLNIVDAIEAENYADWHDLPFFDELLRRTIERAQEHISVNQALADRRRRLLDQFNADVLGNKNLEKGLELANEDPEFQSKYEQFVRDHPDFDDLVGSLYSEASDDIAELVRNGFFDDFLLGQEHIEQYLAYVPDAARERLLQAGTEGKTADPKDVSSLQEAYESFTDWYENEGLSQQMKDRLADKRAKLLQRREAQAVATFDLAIIAFNGPLKENAFFAPLLRRSWAVIVGESEDKT